MDHARHLQDLTSAFSVASTTEQVAAAAVDQVTRALGATGTVVATLATDGKELEIVRVVAMPDGILEKWRRFPVSASVPLADVTRSGEPIYLESRDAWRRRYRAILPLVEESGHHASMVLPLIVESRAVGSIGITFAEPRQFSDEDKEFALSVARQTGQAIERARLFERERLAREEAEKARRLADEANRAKTQFLTTMSHELRTPLNAIAGYTDLIALGVHGPVTSAQAEALERIKRSQRHLLGLINDVLNLARIEAGHVDIDLQEIDLAGTCAEVEPLVAPQMRSKGIAYNCDCGDGIKVMADAEKLRQILLNLLSNAVKFTPAAGTIALSASRVEQSVVIRVTDNGPGIPSDKAELIFGPFIQLDRDLRSGHEGAGLGLSISRNLARLMGGSLIAERSAEPGATFALTLKSA